MKLPRGQWEDGMVGLSVAIESDCEIASEIDGQSLCVRDGTHPLYSGGIVRNFLWFSIPYREYHFPPRYCQSGIFQVPFSQIQTM